MEGKLVRLKPKNEVFHALGVKKTKVKEIKIYTNEKRVELECLLEDCMAFEELSLIEKMLIKQFGDEVFFEFKMELEKKDIDMSELKLLLDRIIDEIKFKTALGKAYFTVYRYKIEEKSIVIELKHNIACEKLKANSFDKKLEKRLYEILGVKLDISFVLGDFTKELKEMDGYTLDLVKVIEERKEQQKRAPKSTDKKADKKIKDPAILLGRKIKEAPISMEDFGLAHLNETVIVSGEVFKMDKRELSTGSIMVSFNITDHKNSLTVKGFVKPEIEVNIEKGMWVNVKGKKQPDRFNQNEDIIFLNSVNKIDVIKKVRKDRAEIKRVELHAHTKMSSLDSVADVADLVDKAASWGHKSLAITDHGVAYAFPFAHKAAKKYEDFKVIFGTEGYLVDDERQMVKDPKDIPLEDECYVVFDIETTGFDPYGDQIIEIGAVKLQGNKIIDRYSSFVKPTVSIPEKITELTGITDEMVKDAEDIDYVLEEFIDFFDDATLVAHNANFDVGFISKKAEKLGVEIKNSVIDTLQWSRNILKNDLKRHNLKAIAKFLNVSLDNHHRAVDDANATAEIFKKFINIAIKNNVYKLTEINEVFKTSVKNSSTNHIIILAKNYIGLKNLYKLISYSHIDHFYRTPRIPKSLLKEHREGLIIGTACEAGELIEAYLRGKPKEELEEIAEFYDYLEIQPNSNNMFLLNKGNLKSVEELCEMNRYICDLGEKLGKPVVATGDVHYIEPEDNLFRSILLFGKGFKDFDSDGGLYMKTTEEMLREFAYLGADKAYEVVVENTNKIAESIEKMQPVPDGFYPPKIEGAEDQVREMTYKKAKKLYGNPLPELLEKRIERELKAIIGNGFAVLYLISQKLVKKSLDDGYLVGSRGSVGSSIVAYMMDITEVNAMYPHYRCRKCKYSEFIELEGCGVDLDDKDCPECGEKLIKDGYSIPFEVFMGFNGDKVPDIDLNFSGEYQSEVHRYTEELFGKENVFRAGTISTLAERNAFGYVRKFVEENELQKSSAEMERLAIGCENVRKTTGQHPGGMIVVPHGHSIYEFTPVQKPANDMKSESITTHFDYHVMDEQLVKLDILGHDDPTTIKLLQEYTGVDIYDVPLDDKDTLSIFSSTEILGVSREQIKSKIGTFGIPEFGTSFVRQMLVDTMPSTVAELVRISGLSHGTDVWINNAQEYVRAGTAKLSEVISVRDDIMNFLIDNGIEKGISFKIMEFVRKGKPSKDPEKWEEYAKLMKEHKVKDWYIESCKKIKYMFPKGHAAAYVMMAIRIAYFKVHYPVAFYCAYLSRKADHFNSDIMLSGLESIEIRRKELDLKKKLDVKEKQEIALLEILIEMNYRGVELLNVDVYKSEAKIFTIEEGKVRVPLIALNGLGESVADKITKEREKTEFISMEDFMRRTKTSKTVMEKIKEFGAIGDISEFNQKKLF